MWGRIHLIPLQSGLEIAFDRQQSHYPPMCQVYMGKENKDRYSDMAVIKPGAHKRLSLFSRNCFRYSKMVSNDQHRGVTFHSQLGSKGPPSTAPYAKLRELAQTGSRCP